MVTVLDRCHSLIQASNELKSASTPAAVILQGAFDSGGVFGDYRLLPRIEELVKTHYVAFRVIGKRNEKLGDAISEIADTLGARPIMTLLVRAHGGSGWIQFGQSSIYMANEVKATDFSRLNEKASIILDVCKTGLDLAKKIAAIQTRPVFAAIDALIDFILTPCCVKHGHEMIGFDDANNMIIRKFQQEGTSVTEVTPCLATVEEIEKSKKTILDQTIKAAEQGDAVAQYDLGNAHCRGLGVLQSYKEAAKWFQKAADQGLIRAQYDLGILYYTEKLEETQFYEYAVYWFWKAAEQGDSIAQYDVGLAYEYGEGVEISIETASMWYQKAANQGHSDAQFRLSQL